MKRDQEVGPGQREEWEQLVMAHTLHQGEKSHVGDDGNRRGARYNPPSDTPFAIQLNKTDPCNACSEFVHSLD